MLNKAYKIKYLSYCYVLLQCRPTGHPRFGAAAHDAANWPEFRSANSVTI